MVTNKNVGKDGIFLSHETLKGGVFLKLSGDKTAEPRKKIDKEKLTKKTAFGTCMSRELKGKTGSPQLRFKKAVDKCRKESKKEGDT